MTCEPGAIEVLTHGLRVRPFSTAFLASSAAPSMTYGLDVLVQEVMAATTTAPWSISKVVPSSRVTGTTLCGRSPAPSATRGLSASDCWVLAGESEAGKDSADASSAGPWTLLT